MGDTNRCAKRTHVHSSGGMKDRRDCLRHEVDPRVPSDPEHKESDGRASVPCLSVQLWAAGARGRCLSGCTYTSIMNMVHPPCKFHPALSISSLVLLKFRHRRTADTNATYLRPCLSQTRPPRAPCHLQAARTPRSVRPWHARTRISPCRLCAPI